MLCPALLIASPGAECSGHRTMQEILVLRKTPVSFRRNRLRSWIVVENGKSSDLCPKTFYELKMPGPTWSGNTFSLKRQSFFPWLNSFHLRIKIKLTTTKKPKHSSPLPSSFITYTKSVWTFKSLCQTYPIFLLCTARNFMQFSWVITIN